MSLLEVKNFSVSYRVKNKKKDGQGNSSKRIKVLSDREILLKVVNDVSFTVEKSDILGIVGESGCGKTTLTKGILSQLPYTEGTILLDGVNTKELSRKDLSEKIQMIFQNPAGSFNPHYSIKKSLIEVSKIHKIDNSEFDSLLRILLDKTSLDRELLDRYPSQLSGGQLQRFAIVRALLVKPRLLIADEAVSALDVSIRGDILKLLQKLHKELDIGVIFISHDLNVVRNICNRVLVMYLGEIVESGDTEQIYNFPQNDYTKLLLASKTKTDPDEEKSSEYIFTDVPNIYELS